MKQLFSGIWQIGNDPATKNITPGKRFFDERLVKEGGQEFRIWDPTRSKLAAAIKKGLKNFPITASMKVLYLGAANGYTSSYISDIVSSGMIYALEFSPRAIRDLLQVSAERKNIVPILADARLPEYFSQRIENVDLIYCDIAQKDQANILIRNASLFLKKGGWAMIAIKARSIDVTKKPALVFSEQRAILERKFKIFEQINLEPYEADHAFFVMRLD